jgi:uncharacterized spore protein YtfJ
MEQRQVRAINEGEYAMQKGLTWCVMAGVLCSLAASAGGQNAEEANKLIGNLATQMKSVLNADSVLGTPRDFDGTKIVPVVSVILGFGSGTGASTKAEDTGRGTGLGGGGYVSPESLLVITKTGEVQVIEAKKGGFSEALKTIVPAVVESMRGKKEQKEPAK